MFKLAQKVRDFLWSKLVHWLTYEKENQQVPLSDFDRLRYELRPGDVVLVEGRSRVADIIKMVTQSIWTHSVLYIGRLHDVDDPELREHVIKFYGGDPHEDHLVIESMLGLGTIVDNLNKYRGEHLRICRPNGLTRQDAQNVTAYTIRQLGTDYNVRQLLDLARFIFPYGVLPRRWRSTLFQHNAGRPTRTVCSTMMAEAFAQVQFPIRPVLHQDDAGKIRMYRRNEKLVTPPDFDYSPYFNVIKYPLLDLDELGVYRKLPWDRSGVHCNDFGDCLIDDTDDIVPTGNETDHESRPKDYVEATPELAPNLLRNEAK